MCSCNKNKPKLNQSKNPTILNSQQMVRAQNVPKPTVVAQSNVQVQVNGVPVVNATNLSPSGLDAKKRRVEALRRAAIRAHLNK